MSDTEQATSIAEYSATEAKLASLREAYFERVFDCTTPHGMKSAIIARAELRTYRVNLEETRQALKKPLLDLGRQIDSQAKAITEQIVALEAPINAQIAAEEEREEAIRAEKERTELDRLRAIVRAQEEASAAAAAQAAAEKRAAEDAERERQFAAIAEDRAKLDAAATEQKRLDAEAAARRAELDKAANERRAAQDEVARLEREKREAELLAEERRMERLRADNETREREVRKAKEEQIIASVSLTTAAEAAVKMLCALGHESHVVTRALVAAIERAK